MTKSNKTLLCCLLTCVMVLACALTILPIATPTTVNAETTEKFVKVTEAPTDGDWSGIYLIVYEAGSVCFDGSLTTLDVVKNNQTVTIVENEIEATPTNKSYSFTISKIESGAFSIKSQSGYYIGRNATKNGLDSSLTTVYENTIECSSNETLTISCKDKKLMYNAAVDQARFRYYGSGQKEVSLFKLVESAAHTHTWGEWKHADGTETHTRTCTADATHTETEKCTFNESNTCTVCGYTKVACDHTELTLVDEVAATCTTTGVKAHYKCANDACGKLFDKNTADKQEVTYASLTIAALGHNYGEWGVEKAATCTAEGKKARICERCADVEEASIPALGHNYGADGKCTLCGESKKNYRLVTDVAQLKEGSKIIIVGTNGSTHTFSTEGDSNFRAVAIEIVDNSVSLGNDVAYIEFTVGVVNDRYTFGYNLDGITKYLYAASSSSNQLKGKTEIDENGQWIVTINDGKTQIRADRSSNRNVMQFNSSNGGLFACYASARQNPVSIYMLEEPEAAKEFTVTETVTAVENGSILNNGTMYILPNGQIDVVYNVTANSGINALEGTIAWNVELFDFVSMTAGNIFGENNVTVSGESATTKKIAVTIGASNNAMGVLLTVRYQLKAGITAEQLANAKFGFTADVLFGTDTTTKVANTATENTVPMAVRQDATLTVNGVDYTADDRTITLTYNGQDITAGTEEGSVLKIATNHTGYNADCLTWTVVKNAGNYVLKIAVTADGAYNAITEVSYTIVVKQVEIASTNIAITNNTTSKDLLGGNAKWTEADFTITYNGETLPDEFSGLYQIAIVNGEVAEAVAQHTLTVELTLTAQASVNYVLTGTDVAEGKLSKQFVVSVVNAAINIIGMPDNVERAYNAQAIDLSGVSVEEGATLKIYVALNDGAETEVTENLDTYVKNVGNYVVRFEAHKNANVYSQTRTYTITKCDLAKVELVYNGDTVTWTDTQTNGETVVVKYMIAATEITNHAYTATQKNTEEVKLVVSTDNANYNGYELALANVYAVTFADDKHGTATQYRFENQLATSITPAAVGGFTFDGWYVTEGETESKYEFTTAVTADVNLTAKWTALTFTVTLMDGETTLNTIDNIAYETPLDTLGITDASKADDEDNYYTFIGWTLTAEGEVIDLATTKVTDNMTLYAKFTSASNKFTLTWTLTYNGNAVENGTLTVKRNTALANIAGLPASKNANVLTIGTWKNGENEFTAMPTANVEITAAYEIALQAGDVNGDGKVNLDDVVLFRKYLVGGYAMDVVADENIYTAITAADAASKTMFFKCSANLDNDANLDIRDVATIRMNVVATTEGGEEQTQTTQSAARMEVVSEAVQYAVLPTNKFVA